MYLISFDIKMQSQEGIWKTIDFKNQFLIEVNFKSFEFNFRDILHKFSIISGESVISHAILF